MGNARNLAFWLVLLMLVLALFQVLGGGQSSMSSDVVSYSEFMSKVDDGTVSAVDIDGERVYFTGEDSRRKYAINPGDNTLVKELVDKGVAVKGEPQQESGLMPILMSFLPFILIIGVWIYFMNQMQGGGGKAMGFGKVQGQTADRESMAA